MNSQEKHDNTVNPFPQHVKQAHKHAVNHRDELLQSEVCGCFYCSHLFKPSQISEWIDVDNDGVGTTARCPFCGIDSVIGSASGYPITEDFLEELYTYWFCI